MGGRYALFLTAGRSEKVLRREFGSDAIIARIAQRGHGDVSGDGVVATVSATVSRTPWGGLPSELFQPWLTYCPQRPVRLVAARQRLLCQSMWPMRRHRGKVLFDVPVGEVGISVFRAKNTDAIWFNSPSLKGQDWRFIIAHRFRPDLYHLLSVAQDNGARITPIVRR